MQRGSDHYCSLLAWNTGTESHLELKKKKKITKGNRQLGKLLIFRLRSTKLHRPTHLHSWFRDQRHCFSFLNSLLLISVLQLSVSFTLCVSHCPSCPCYSNLYPPVCCCCLASSTNPCRLAGNCSN